MSDAEREREFLAQTRRALDDSAAEIDPATRARLRAGRADALHRAKRKPLRWLPAASLATAAAAVALALALWRGNAPPLAQPAEDLTPLTADDDLDLYLDLDLYTWLEEDADAG